MLPNFVEKTVKLLPSHGLIQFDLVAIFFYLKRLNSKLLALVGSVHIADINIYERSQKKTLNINYIEQSLNY